MRLSAGIASRWLRDRLEEIGRVMKIVQTDNIAAHYRAPIYVKMAKEPGTSLPWGLTPLYSARSQEVERSLEGCGIAAVVGGECGGHPRNGIICSR